MHVASIASAITTNEQFEKSYRRKARVLLKMDPVNRGPAHAMKDDTTSSTHELMYVTEVFELRDLHTWWAEVVKPNLPWAEDHFQERVGGKPLNPAPSEAWWPFARAGNAEHKQDEIFSHTYPERFWPKQAGDIEDQGWDIDSPTSRAHFGIRFAYGDLSDLVRILGANPNSRQAYLPIWFPEDLAASAQGQRVPCSMGYHFILNNHKLDCVYTMRSCDVVRFYRDDIYMAGRLLQWVCEEIGQAPGNLIVHINNLHCFPGDRPFLENVIAGDEEPEDKRASYNFGALG